MADGLLMVYWIKKIEQKRIVAWKFNCGGELCLENHSNCKTFTNKLLEFIPMSNSLSIISFKTNQKCRKLLSANLCQARKHGWVSRNDFLFLWKFNLLFRLLSCKEITFVDECYSRNPFKINEPTTKKFIHFDSRRISLFRKNLNSRSTHVTP